MIKIKPDIQHDVMCPYCGGETVARKVVWQGIHVAVETNCSRCHVEMVADLPIGQASYTPYAVNKATGEIFGDKDAMGWFGRPFLDSLLNPDSGISTEIQIEKRRMIESAVILNCIDYLYGHSLLKLLNADTYKHIDGRKGLIVIVPSFLRWMVPDYVAEIWAVNIPLSEAQNFFPSLHVAIEEQLDRFDEVSISLAHSHPRKFSITNFSGVRPHELGSDSYRITFVWREDRIWVSTWLARLLAAFRLDLYWQNHKVVRLLKLLRKSFPLAKITVAGLGKTTRFPPWVDDARVSSFDERSEKATCHIYSESRLIVGVHGSNMLLPSAHAWATIDLMPSDRWPNLAQDILYQDGKTQDARITSWRYRFLPIRTTVNQVSIMGGAILLYARTALRQFAPSASREL